MGWKKSWLIQILFEFSKFVDWTWQVAFTVASRTQETKFFDNWHLNFTKLYQKKNNHTRIKKIHTTKFHSLVKNFINYSFCLFFFWSNLQDVWEFWIRHELSDIQRYISASVFTFFTGTESCPPLEKVVKVVQTHYVSS